VNAVRLPATEATPHTSAQSAGSQSTSHNAGDCANSHSASSHSALSECVTRTVRRYLADIGDTECAEGLHAMVLREVEVPLLREVLAFHDGNQSRAASALGINRATLRKKLILHGLL
jgi:Fis family transcriptional regulator